MNLVQTTHYNNVIDVQCSMMDCHPHRYRVVGTLSFSGPLTMDQSNSLTNRKSHYLMKILQTSIPCVKAVRPDAGSTARAWFVATARDLKASLSMVSACLVVGCGGTAPGNDMPPIPQSQAVRPGIWVVMGSSTAAGAGAAPGKGWVNLLQSDFSDRGAQFASIAKNGSVTYQGLSASTAPNPGKPGPDPSANIDQALSRKPVMLILAYPTNDTASGYSTEETVANLLSMRALAQNVGVPVIVLSTQPRNLTVSQLSQLRDIDARLRAYIGPCFVDVRTRLAGPDDQLAAAYNAGDGIHPNDAGHSVIAGAVRATVDGGACVRLVP
jgi:acyl-CoA thioesterase-1